MSKPPTWQDQEDLTQPPGYFQVRKPLHSPTPPSNEGNLASYLDTHNRGLVALTLSGLVALIAFFMPYFTASTVVAGVPTFLNIPLAESSPLPTSGSDAANGFPLLWLVLLVAVVVITVAAVLVLDNSALRNALTPIIGALVFLVSGLIGFVVLIFSLARANSDISSANHLLNEHSVTKYHIILGIGPGFWLSLVAMMAVAILGGISLRRAW
ncbi:MAG: hypothetical protein C5B60_06245 [Chloroflexi bacterium]|nr:MAG: hypothetical protein C5B60_06245 [Chloroflexota bacterium]